MNFTRENGMYFFGDCESCGSEVKAMRAHCKKDLGGYKINRPVKCNCGASSDFFHKLQEVTSNNTTTEDSVTCPRCRSTQIYAGKKGFGLAKAAVGGVLLGGVGLLGGLIGSKKLMLTCMKCSYKWEAGSNN